MYIFFKNGGPISFVIEGHIKMFTDNLFITNVAVLHFKIRIVDLFSFLR